MDNMDWKEKVLPSLLGLSYLAMKQAERQYRLGERKTHLLFPLFCWGFVLVLGFFWNPPRRNVILQLIFICVVKLFWFYRLQIKGHKDIYALGICMRWG